MALAKRQREICSPAQGKLVNQSDIKILARYNAKVRGLYNYYSIANDKFIS